MANITKRNYNATGKTGFENSPAKVWHVNELVGTTIGYKSIAGFINFTSVPTETLTILTNDTGIPDSSITVAKNSTRAKLLLTIPIPGNTARYAAILAKLNLADSNDTHVNTISATPNASSTTENFLYDIVIQRITNNIGVANGPISLALGGSQPNIIYFEFKLFI